MWLTSCASSALHIETWLPSGARARLEIIEERFYTLLLTANGSHFFHEKSSHPFALSCMDTRIRTSGHLILALLTIGIALGVRCASAASVLYDNGLFNGSIAGWTINSGFQVADTFTLAGSSTLTGANFAAWVSSGDAAQTLDWAIVGDPTDQVSTTFYSGSAAPLGNTFLLTNGFGFDVYNESFDLGSLSLGAGTYWLVLMNGTTAQGDVMFWDENDGPSQAWESTLGFLTVANSNCASNASGNCSEAFQILGTTSGIPEPSTLALGASGLLLVAAALRQKRRLSSGSPHLESPRISD